jgi:hypothetical protein
MGIAKWLGGLKEGAVFAVTTREAESKSEVTMKGTRLSHCRYEEVDNHEW